MQGRRQVLNCCNYDTAAKNKEKKTKENILIWIQHITVVGGAGFTTGTERYILYVISVVFTQVTVLSLMNNLY